MLSFSMMFYVQLGPVMEGYFDQQASFISLSRALFGDFDVPDILNNSKGYVNVMLFLVYLFVAVFIMLSMFLAILGESQNAVRMVQDDQRREGRAPPEYGIFFYLGEFLGRTWTAIKCRTRRAKLSPDQRLAHGCHGGRPAQLALVAGEQGRAVHSRARR